jgi:UDPglucose 6-dehydrogenase
MLNLNIGFIGQGFIGKNYADDFINRGYKVIRYALEPEYASNKEKIAECDLVFIAVPTPTKHSGFDDSYLRAVLPLIGKGKSVIIKSTIIPGTCEKLQTAFSDIFIFHSPEFLTEKTAAFDAANPTRNIVGYPVDNEEYKKRAQEILDVLPKAPVSFICRAKEAELIKYASNCFLMTKVVYANVLYDLAASEGMNWESIMNGFGADPRIGMSHLNPIHQSGVNGKIGRGAGGHCFVKDFAALRMYAEAQGLDNPSLDFLRAIENKNVALLRESTKDLDILADIY